MIIQKMTSNDVSAVLKIGMGVTAFEVSERDCFWSREQLEKWIEADEDVLLVAKENDEIVGFALSMLHKPTGKVTWENLYVLQNFRNRGVGQQLIGELLLRLRQKGASYMCFFVRAENQDEVSFFQHLDFVSGYNFVWFEKHL
ncbi:MAG: GNAT family N-acetyltransferase [Patescibacteria group bacterium]